MSFTSYVAWSSHFTSPSFNVLFLQTGMMIVPNPWHCGNKIRASCHLAYTVMDWYVIGMHWAGRRADDSIIVEWRQIQEEKQAQRRGQEALGAESWAGVGITGKVMGEGDGGQWACRSSHQDLVPKYYVNGNTSGNFTQWYKDKNNLPSVTLGHSPPAFFLWLYTNEHMHACLFFFFFYKDGIPGTPTILKPAFFWLTL